MVKQTFSSTGKYITYVVSFHSPHLLRIDGHGSLGSSMAGLMKDAGFVDIEPTLFQVTYGKYKTAFTDFLEMFTPFCLTLGGCEGLKTPEEAREVIDGCKAEIAREPIYVNLIVTVGRRPASV